MDNFIYLISSLRWQDIVDIGLVSYILLRFYVLFRGTNAFRVLIGILILWFFQQVAASMGLVVTSWVVQAVVAVGAIIIIVIFRNEIRNVLLARNLKSIFWDFSSKTVITAIETIVQSVHEMAQHKCGALIVFPGKEDLEEVVLGGIAWKGEISKEMILSIFWPDNPVHDGAAVIQGDQIKQVAAILPLSRRDDLPSHYGTRHRAALGLAEATDALVILLSYAVAFVLRDRLLPQIFPPYRAIGLFPFSIFQPLCGNEFLLIPRQFVVVVPSNKSCHPSVFSSAVRILSLRVYFL